LYQCTKAVTKVDALAASANGCAGKVGAFVSVRSRASELLYIANALAHHHIGLEETDDGVWSVFLNTVLLAKLDERGRILHD